MGHVSHFCPIIFIPSTTSCSYLLSSRSGSSQCQKSQLESEEFRIQQTETSRLCEKAVFSSGFCLTVESPLYTQRAAFQPSQLRPQRCSKLYFILKRSGSDPELPSAEWVQLPGKLPLKRRIQTVVSFPFHAVTKNMLIQPFNRLAISTYSAFAMFLIIYGFLFLLNCFSSRFWLKFMWFQHYCFFH